jgi:hypothetical protein
VIATNGGWLPLTEHTAEDVARSTMLLACSPEHIDALRADTAEHPVAPPVGRVDRPR